MDLFLALAGCTVFLFLLCLAGFLADVVLPRCPRLTRLFEWLFQIDLSDE